MVGAGMDAYSGKMWARGREATLASDGRENVDEESRTTRSHYRFRDPEA
jgi:hypothetical protein